MPQGPSFGEWLAAQRGSKSRKSFGAELGVSENTITSWEIGSTEPQAGNLVMIGRRFGVDYNTLMSFFGAPVLRSVERMATTIKRRPRLSDLFDAAVDLDNRTLDYLVISATALKAQQDSRAQPLDEKS